MRPRRKVIWWPIGMLPLAVVALVASAGDVHTWTGTQNGNWSGVGNWQTSSLFTGPPDGNVNDNDSAIIDDTSPQSTVQYDMINPDYEMWDILLGDGMTLELVSPNRLNLRNRLTIQGDVIINGGGVFDGISVGGVQKIFIDGGGGGASLTKGGTGELAIGRLAPPPPP